MARPPAVGTVSAGAAAPQASNEAMRAAVALARSIEGDDEMTAADEAELRDVVAAVGDPVEVVRGAALLIGGLGEHVAGLESSDDTDAVELVAASLRRVQSAEAVAPEGLPLAAGLLTAALVSRMDTLAWIDDVGPRLAHMAPVLEVLAALIALVDIIYERPGLALDLIASAAG